MTKGNANATEIQRAADYLYVRLNCYSPNTYPQSGKK